MLRLLAVFALLLSPALAQPPNVVFILADDLGYGDLGCYGHPKFRTPRIDQLAKQGVRLTQFNTPAPFCAPTRAALLTGRYPFRCGMTANPAPDATPAADAVALPAGEVTLARVLKTAGYATALFGKWHLGHHAGSLPTDRGFDEYLGIPYSNDMRPAHLLEGSKVVEYPVVQATLTERLSKRAADFIRRRAGQPFFLLYADPMPHKPLAASEAHYRRSGAGLYGDALLELDAGVGRVLDALDQAGVADHTLVVFTSDNGPWFGGSTGGLRGMKASQWEGGYRVPMLARWPGKIPAGRVSNGLGITMDLFATALKASGAALPDTREIDGRDLLPLLRGETASPHEFIFGHQGPQLGCVRDARWKLHVLPAVGMRFKAGPDGRWPDPRAPDGVTLLAPYEQYNLESMPGLTTGVAAAPMQLFDLANDPGEQRDVAAEHPEVVRRLRAAHEAMSRDVPMPPKAPR
jgi:uncharacterized sulfatase